MILEADEILFYYKFYWWYGTHFYGTLMILDIFTSDFLWNPLKSSIRLVPVDREQHHFLQAMLVISGHAWW